MTILLSNLEFYAYHGWHSEEKKIGANFILDVSVDFEPGKKVEELSDTLNYVEIFEKIKEVFGQPVKLLETLAEDICQKIYSLDDRINTINIKITKLNPPIANFSGKVSVQLQKHFP